MRSELLKRISIGIISARQRHDELKSTVELARFFSAWKLDLLPGFQENGIIEFSTASGIAISPVEAAHCTTDYLRTARFIKAVYAALNELFRRFPNQQLHVLYAGCGPYATLILPLLPFFSPEQLKLVLLDIHSSSLESTRHLVMQLGFEHHHIDFVTSDATTYINEEGFHLILTETMFQALIREPQVAITEHLRSQILPKGIFLPEEIKLEVACTFFGKEPYLKNSADIFVLGQEKLFVPALKRWQLGTLFSISCETDFHTLTRGTSAQIESDYYKIPQEANNYPDVCIFTQLRIFGTIYLHPSESLITNPHCVASLANMSGYSHFRLIYDYRSVPGWTYQLNKID
jgi:hypothetical protein